MDKVTKTKIIIAAIFAILVLLAVLVSVAFTKKKPTDNNPDEVSLRAERKNDFTTEDMMKAQENKSDYQNTQASSVNNLSVNSQSTGVNSVPAYHGDNSEIEELQKQLRENQRAQSQEETSSEPVQSPPSHKKPKTKRVSFVSEVSTAAPVVAAVKEPAPAPKPKPNGRSRNLSSGGQSATSNLISAVIHNDQVITSGAKVKLRLTQDVVMNGVTIPRNSFVFGIATFSKTRLTIALQTIVIGNSIYPFNKTVCDKDGMEGIYLPENIRAEDASEATTDMTNEALSTVNGSGIIGAALNTGKSMFRKKSQRQTVTLKANYKLFLK